MNAELTRLPRLYWHRTASFILGLLEKAFRESAIILDRRARTLERRRQTRNRGTPPMNAEFLFYLFMTPQNCHAFVGDLEERYTLIHKKFGHRRANFWYWTQAIRSLGPIAWAWAKKVSIKPIFAVVTWAVAKGLIGHDGWLATVLELYRKIRS